MYAVLWLTYELFANCSTELWLLIGVNILIFRNNEWILIKFCLYIWSMLWLIHIIFPNFSTELWPLIDFRIMFMLNILWNNWWIWSKLVDTLIFYTKTYATTKISTMAGYHVVLATLLLIDKNTLCVDVEKHLVRDMLCVGLPMGFRGWVGW